MKKYLPLFCIMACFIITKAQEGVPHANPVLMEACEAAATENKNVFIIFHASWCGWCRKMDNSMNDASCKEFFDRNYVIRHLVIKESPENKHLENPGAEELFMEHGGDGQGIPYWLIFDSDGNLLADSRNSSGENVGCPARPEEVDHFIDVLKKTSSITEKEQETIRKVFLKNG